MSRLETTGTKTSAELAKLVEGAEALQVSRLILATTSMQWSASVKSAIAAEIEGRERAGKPPIEFFQLTGLGTGGVKLATFGGRDVFTL